MREECRPPFPDVRKFTLFLAFPGPIAVPFSCVPDPSPVPFSCVSWSFCYAFLLRFVVLLLYLPSILMFLLSELSELHASIAVPQQCSPRWCHDGAVAAGS